MALCVFGVTLPTKALIHECSLFVREVDQLQMKPADDVHSSK